MRQVIPDIQYNITESGKAFGRFVYENGKLSYIINADGVYRAVYNDPQALTMIEPEININLYPGAGEYLKGFTREIHLKDHLGKVRAVFDYSNLQSENHYYPFGLPIHNLCTSTAPEGKENRYLYNGKELQDDLGLNWMDYGARFYDAGIGRWHSVDPMAEKYFSSTPYSYVESNPIVFIDPNGEDKVIAIVYNKRSTSDKSLWAVEVAYDMNKKQGSYKGMIQGDDYSGNFQGKFNSENKSNYLNASLITRKIAVGIYHQYQDGKQDFGLTDANTQDFSFDQRWAEDGTNVPTSIATGIADAFDMLNEISIGEIPLGEAGADAINEKFKEFGGTVDYIKGKDGNHSFRFIVDGTDISFKIDYIITKDERKENEE